MADQEVVESELAALSPAARGHVLRLVRSAPILADLSEADLLVLLPSAHDTFVTVGHRRPINARTLYDQDQMGNRLTSTARPLLQRSFRSGEVEDGGLYQPAYNRWIRTLAVPVRHQGQIVAMVAREFSPDVKTQAGGVQFVAFSILRRIANMIATGQYPYREASKPFDHPPRVGDGLIVLDNRAAIEYASPNAITNLRGLGIHRKPMGHRLRELGAEQEVIRQSLAHRIEVVDEISQNGRIVSVACYPLTEDDGVRGAMVLLRDITELRERERLLLTKDATIAEINHRVKNNLQTISSLLHLQQRRTNSDEASEALRDSVRRIRTIATVHEMLSHSTSDKVEFSEIVERLVNNMRSGLMGNDSPVRVHLHLTPVTLPSGTATSLAVVLSELLQNTLDHANATAVTVRLVTGVDELQLSVLDNGTGFPPRFELREATGLGLTIVRTIVESELRGSLAVTRPEPAATGRELAAEPTMDTPLGVTVRIPRISRTA